MRRFVAEQNIRHFTQILESETDLDRRSIVEQLLVQAERELAEAEREFEELERAARSGDTTALSIANDDGEHSGVRRSSAKRRR